MDPAVGSSPFRHSILPAAHSRSPTVSVKVLVVLAEAFLAVTASGYAFSSRKGDLAGSAILVWTLLGIFVCKSSRWTRPDCRAFC